MNMIDVIRQAPNPANKTDSDIAQVYRNWYYGVRAGNIPAVRTEEELRYRKEQVEMQYIPNSDVISDVKTENDDYCNCDVFIANNSYTVAYCRSCGKPPSPLATRITVMR